MKKQGECFVYAAIPNDPSILEWKNLKTFLFVIIILPQ